VAARDRDQRGPRAAPGRLAAPDRAGPAGRRRRTADFADDASGRLDDAARVKAVHRALAALPGPELEVLALCVWSALGYAEAAEALGVPVGTVAWAMTATPKTAYDVLAALPVNRRALLAVIAAKSAGQSVDDLGALAVSGGAPTTEAQREFDFLGMILWNATIGVGGPPAAEAAAYRALATLPGISVQPAITATAGGQAIGISDDGGLDQLLLDPASYQVIGIRNLASGITAPTVAQMLASGHLPADLRAHLATMTKAQRAQYIALAESAAKHPAATPRRGTVMQEIVYTENTEVRGPGDR
jgi:hypothetical protein